jgi:hypothetical protein
MLRLICIVVLDILALGLFCLAFMAGNGWLLLGSVVLASASFIVVVSDV